MSATPASWVYMPTGFSRLCLALSLLLSPLAAAPEREARPKQTCELYNEAQDVFLGRVLEHGQTEVPYPIAMNRISPPVPAETIRVAVLERFKGKTRSKQTLVPSFPPFSGPSPLYMSLVFSPPVEIGGTYLFYSRGAYPNYTHAQAIVPLAEAPLEELRHRQQMTTGSIRGRVDGWWEDPRIAITAHSNNSGFQASTRVFGEVPYMGYQFDSLPPGPYSFSLDMNGVEFEPFVGIQLDAGGCGTVDLFRGLDFQHVRGPQTDCSWAEQHPSLCEKFQSAGAVLVGRIVKKGNGFSKTPDLDPNYFEKWQGRFAEAPQPDPQFGYEMHVLPVDVLRGPQRKIEVRYERLNNHPFCGDRVEIGETYLIFAEYLDSQSVMFKPLAFYKMSESLSRKVQQCRR
jgi:hypothetical protein